MFLQLFPSGPLFTNAYVVACDETKEAAIIDPAPGSTAQIEKYFQQNGLHCKHILLTHSHWDHIAEVGPLKDRHQVPVYIHSLDVPNLEEPGADQLPCPIHIQSVKPDVLLEDGSTIKIGTLTFQVIHTPGHSPGSVCFYEPAYNTLISGDTLFQGTMGNVSFPTSRPDLMRHSLSKLAALPPQTKVYPGHGPMTTIGNEGRTLRR